MTENERIKELRINYLNKMTLEEFGLKVGVSKAAMSNIENGNRNVTAQMRLAICREFHVREEWLIKGEGEPFSVPDSREGEIAEFIGRTLSNKSNDFQLQLLHVLTMLTADEWNTLAEIAEMLRIEAHYNDD